LSALIQSRYRPEITAKDEFDKYWGCVRRCYDPLFVHPKISRREAPTRVAAATLTTATEAAVGGSRPLQAVETTLIQPGLALFPVTGIFQRGGVGVASDLERAEGSRAKHQ
jgi:hypothetical protein